MRRIILITLMMMLANLSIMAQSSSMTDAQIIDFVQKEQKLGTSNAQIVTKLMQRGVDINQIRRVRSKYEKAMKEEGSLGSVTGRQPDSRLRENNGQLREDVDSRTQSYSNYRIKESKDGKRVKYDETNPEYLDMLTEMEMITPTDSIAWLERLLQEQEDAKNKVFGRDIFNNKDLSFEPNMNIATPQDYVLGPGDAVVIDIYGASQKSIESTISPDGEVIVEGFGPVEVGGLTVAQANSKLRSTVGARYSSSTVKLTVGQTKTIMVNVMGEVLMPGTYTLSAFATVFHALYMAGGTNELGTLRNIKVYRNNKLVTTVDIYDYIINGKLTGNVRLADNDVIVVGPYDCLVNITGKVKRPMFYEMRKDESVSSILKYAGGFTGDAYTNSVKLTRKTGREYAAFNVGEFEFSSFHLADGDSIGVDSVIARYHNTVEIKGAVFRPGMYNIGEKVNSVRTLVEQAEGLTEEAFVNRAVMHRMKPDRTLEVLSIDINGIMNGTVADVPLRENDVLFIPTKDIVQEERTLTIRGEVQYPGTYKYAENETVEDLVLQAGGLTDKASVVKVNVARRIKDPKAVRPDSTIAKVYTMALKDGFVVDGTPGFVLMPFDEVSVFKSPGTVELQNVTIEGQVMFEGSYTLSKRNARLSDLLKEAGGVTDMAYIRGARLERKTNEIEKERMEMAYQMAMEQQQKNILEMASASNNGASIAQFAEKNQQKSVEKFKVPTTYPVGIELDKALANPGCDADIVLREGDKLIVPTYNGTVKINGAVMYPNTVAFEDGKKAKHYIKSAGGYAQDARKSGAYIIYMNGMVAKVGGGTKVEPGCEIVVPSKTINKMTMAEKLAMGSSMSSIAAMIATIANMVR